MKLLYYDISFSSNKEKKYDIFPNGIVKISQKDCVIFLRPANRVFAAEGQQLWLWGSKKPIPELYFSEFYYPEGGLLKSKPHVCYVDIILCAKEEGVFFRPKENKVINAEGKIISVLEYVVIDDRPPSPFNYGDTKLFGYTYNNDWFNLVRRNDEDKIFKLSKGKNIGFILGFSMPPPTPGDLFSIHIDGLEYNGSAIEIPIVEYDSKKTYVFGAS